MLPVSVMFGRSPGREGHGTPHLRLLNGVQKFFAVLWLGRDSFVRFSNTVSLRRMATEHGTDKTIAQKLARVARMHFSRQRLAAVGPSLPARQDLFNKLLASKAIEKAVEDEARSKKISHEKAQQNAIALMEEIAADFSYETVRLSDRVLSWTWNRLYQGINVTNAERVRQLAQDGHGSSTCPATVATWTTCCCPTCCITRAWCRRTSPRASTSTSGRPARSSAAWARSSSAAPSRATSCTRRCSANTSASCSPAATRWNTLWKVAVPAPGVFWSRRPAPCR